LPKIFSANVVAIVEGRIRPVLPQPIGSRSHATRVIKVAISMILVITFDRVIGSAQNLIRSFHRIVYTLGVN